MIGRLKCTVVKTTERRMRRLEVASEGKSPFSDEFPAREHGARLCSLFQVGKFIYPDAISFAESWR